jgi:putative toxin-antitoxin system, toxin component
MSNVKEGEYMKGFYTVSQYAAILGKDSGNIRRMLINGKLIGEKVGNQWLIPETAEISEDKRIKSGQYRNWRNKTRINKKYPGLLKQLTNMCIDIGEIYGDVIEEIILYGSYVRGQEVPESDIDIAVILRLPDTDELHRKMIDIVVDNELDLEITLSVITIEEDNLNEWKSTLPFYKNLLKEGISLWKNERENYQSTALKQA